MLLEDVKTLVGIDEEDISKDKLLNIYVKRAVTSIKNYLNNNRYTDEVIRTEFCEAVVSLTVSEFKSKDRNGIQSESQGSRRISYHDVSVVTGKILITDEIKSLLPTPSMSMR